MTLDQGMLRHVTQRLLGVVPTLLLLITVVFFLVRVAPGGPFDGEKALPPEIQANLEAEYHLDEPLLQQYFRYLGNVLVLDFGPSFQYRDWTVNELIAQGFPVSLTIGGVAMLIGFLVGVSIGIGAALRQNSAADFTTMGFAMLGVSIPNFVVAPVLILAFAVYAGWLPAGGLHAPDAAMLSWPAGPRPEDGVWAPHWYHNVHRSTGFLPYRPKAQPIPARLEPLLAECRPHYQTLYASALRAGEGR